MATEIRLRRGTSAQHATFTGAEGEPTYDASLQTIRIHNGTTPGGHRLARHGEIIEGGRYVGSDETHNIPGDFASIPDALAEISKWAIAPNVHVTLMLQAGYAIPGPIEVLNGDFSGVIIQSVDAVVPLAAGFPNTEWFHAVFLVREAIMPTLDCLIDAGGKGGYAAINLVGSRATIRSGAGVTNAGTNALATRASIVHCVGAVFTNAVLLRDTTGTTTGSAIRATDGSVIYANGAVCDDSRYYGAQAAYASIMSFRGGSAQNAGRHGVRSTYASNVDAFEANVSGSGHAESGAGFRCYDNSLLVCRDGIATAARVGVWARFNSKVFCSGLSAVGCRSGIVADDGAEVYGNGVDVQNATYQGMQVTNGGSFKGSINISGSNHGVSLESGGLVDVSALTAQNTQQILVDNATLRVGETGLDITGCQGAGSPRCVVDLNNGATADLRKVIAPALAHPTPGSYMWAFLVDNGSTLTAADVNLAASQGGFLVYNGSKVILSDVDCDNLDGLCIVRAYNNAYVSILGLSAEGLTSSGSFYPLEIRYNSCLDLVGTSTHKTVSGGTLDLLRSTENCDIKIRNMVFDNVTGSASGLTVNNGRLQGSTITLTNIASRAIRLSNSVAQLTGVTIDGSGIQALWASSGAIVTIAGGTVNTSGGSYHCSVDSGSRLAIDDVTFDASALVGAVTEGSTIHAANTGLTAADFNVAALDTIYANGIVWAS